jgi:hypothetical protein
MCKQVIHLTTFSKDLVLIHLEDDFLDENLTIIKAIPKCGILEHSTNVVGVIQEQICFKIHINNMHFSLMPSHLYQRNGDGILRQCVTYHEVPSMLKACHDNACDNHFLNI